jgi:enoyl-CoA hydratase
MNLVQLDNVDGVAVVTLNDPDHRNAVSLAMAGELAGAVRAAADAPDVHALVVTGAGRAFCAGGDRATLRDADEVGLRTVYQAFLEVRACPLPTWLRLTAPPSVPA